MKERKQTLKEKMNGWKKERKKERSIEKRKLEISNKVKPKCKC